MNADRKLSRLEQLELELDALVERRRALMREIREALTEESVQTEHDGVFRT